MLSEPDNIILELDIILIQIVLQIMKYRFLLTILLNKKDK
jgi:hypothetical protein